ncbi:dihydroneopterin triphosphate diphosphatase [Craterilacuibacter sp. RT1T]|uniref:dihydroneopterin triphosphate diphosphatase n=1 Tax=Craterilacuibacter sp. RT1T TaxID=2942211 RepID=UPI0020BD5A79|nr:dihydroneopterin triphosphate diphosphatase [Craterilacuibacter sp. RT1T]MCL6262390.1 dihydroneopterin triphosphate diphosphatase [Craterilacuibacter sp. RT1T]
MAGNKQPVSVLVLLYSACGRVLLIERADKPGFWQSVTGSREGQEALLATAWRELGEETGFSAADGVMHDWAQSSVYEIYPHWRHRYPEGVTHNTEHVFAFELSAEATPRLNAREHIAYVWLDWQEAAQRVFSPSNAVAIRELGRRLSPLS